jgi:hypothetical protein
MDGIQEKDAIQAGSISLLDDTYACSIFAARWQFVTVITNERIPSLFLKYGENRSANKWRKEYAKEMTPKPVLVI